MSTVFDLLVSDRLAPAAAVPVFQRYLADPGFQAVVEPRMLMQHRISLATLAGSPPGGMSQAMMINVLHDMRHRFRSALELLRDLDFNASANRGTA